MTISIITTSYNYSEYIRDTIESVLNQTYTDFEYIIFDDGSTDNSLEIIESYAKKDNRIKLYTHPNNENRGLIATNIAAIQKCKENSNFGSGGGYIVFLESDDIIIPDYLELKIKAANEFPQAGIIFNDAKLIGDVNSKRACAIQKTLDRKKELINKENVDFYNLYIENLIISFSFVMVKKELLFNIPLDFNIPQCYDWYLWNNILNKNNIVIFIDKPLTNFRIHETSQSCTKVSSSYLLEKLKQDKNEFKSVSQKIYYNIFRIILVNNRMEKLFRPLYKKIKKIFCCKLYNLKNKIIKVIKL